MPDEYADQLLDLAHKPHSQHAGAVRGANFVECRVCGFHAHSTIHRYLVQHGYGVERRKLYAQDLAGLAYPA